MGRIPPTLSPTLPKHKNVGSVNIGQAEIITTEGIPLQFSGIFFYSNSNYIRVPQVTGTRKRKHCILKNANTGQWFGSRARKSTTHKIPQPTCYFKKGIQKNFFHFIFWHHYLDMQQHKYKYDIREMYRRFFLRKTKHSIR